MCLRGDWWLNVLKSHIVQPRTACPDLTVSLAEPVFSLKKKWLIYECICWKKLMHQIAGGGGEGGWKTKTCAPFHRAVQESGRVHYESHPQDITPTNHDWRLLSTISIVSLATNANSALMGWDESIGAAESSLSISVHNELGDSKVKNVGYVNCAFGSASLGWGSILRTVQTSDLKNKKRSMRICGDKL